MNLSFDHPEYSDTLNLYRVKPNYGPFLKRLASHVRSVDINFRALESASKYVDLSLPLDCALPNHNDIVLTASTHPSAGYFNFNIAKHLLPHISRYFHGGLRTLTMTVLDDDEPWGGVRKWLTTYQLLHAAAQNSPQLRTIAIYSPPFMYTPKHQAASLDVLAQFTELRVLRLPMSALTPSLLLTAFNTLQHVEAILPSTLRLSTARVVQSGTLQVPDSVDNQMTVITEVERMGCGKLTSLSFCTTTDQVVPLLIRCFPKASHPLTALISISIHIAPQRAAAHDFFGFDTVLAQACPSLTHFRLEFLPARDFAAFTAATPTPSWPLFRALSLCKRMQRFSVVCPSAMAFALSEIGEMLAGWPTAREVVVAGASDAHPDRVAEGVRTVDVPGESEASSLLMAAGTQAWRVVDAQCQGMYGEIFCASEYEDGIFGWYFQLKIDGRI